MSNDAIDGWYSRERKAGAVGGKLLGAGAGGCLMFYAPQEKHATITSDLKELRPIKFDFEPQVSKIIFVHD